MVIDCCGATRAPLLIRSFGRIGNAQSTSVGRLNNMGLGIEEPKHDLGWPSLRPLFRDNVFQHVRSFIGRARSLYESMIFSIGKMQIHFQ